MRICNYKNDFLLECDGTCFEDGICNCAIKCKYSLPVNKETVKILMKESGRTDRIAKVDRKWNKKLMEFNLMGDEQESKE